jgi:hypothetical protein
MCLKVIDKINLKEDMEVYKIEVNSDNGWVTLIQGVKLLHNEKLVAESNIDYDQIEINSLLNEGVFHSFIHLEDAIYYVKLSKILNQNMGFRVVKCIIPLSSKCFIGKCLLFIFGKYFDSIGSTEIIITDEILYEE